MKATNGFALLPSLKPIEESIVEVIYLDGESQEFPFGDRINAETFRDRMRRRKDVISVTLSPEHSKH